MNVNQVILIDDDEVVNFFDKMVLSKLGLKDSEIKVFNNVATALRYLDQTQKNIDRNLKGIILLDIQMPELDGWDFLSMYDRLSSELKQHFKIIMLTSDKHPYIQEKNKYHNLIHDFLNKPLTLPVFQGIVGSATAENV
ncbi:MAG: CheY-like chemotaxis protein [Flavobacteriales bacterium]|jgi:CheY-like chemotaxis protein